MPQVPAQSFYNGPFAIYTSPTGLTDPITGLPELGGTLHEGDYVDLTASEAQQWSIAFGSKLYPGRYRFVRVATAATAANIVYGAPVGIAKGTTVATVVLSAAGSGYTAGSYTCASSASGGTQTAQATVTVNASGAIASCQLINPGAGFTSVPTFSLSEIPAGSAGSILAQMAISPSFVTSFDASAVQLDTVRGIFLSAPTSTQVSANCYVIIQEQGIAPVLVTTATNTAAGVAGAATTSATVTTTTPTTSRPVGFFGYSIDLAAASTICRFVLDLPVWQG